MERAREVRTLFEMYAFKGVGTHVVDSRQDDNLLFFLDVNLYSYENANGDFSRNYGNMSLK